MNAHLEDLGGYTDMTRNMYICEDHDLVVVNNREKCGGEITWESGNRQTTIDYCLMSQRLYTMLGKIEIDEDRKKSLGSDHKRVRIPY